MTSEKKSRPEPEPETTEQDIEEALAEVERSLLALKERHANILNYKKRQAELQHRLEEVRPELRRQKTQELRKELGEIKAELETIELNLESSLFGWNSVKEPFWQAVRFGGLGIIIGWVLKSCAG